MKKEIFCSSCGSKFIPVGREHICPSCKQEAAAAVKRAAVERAKERSYNGEACPVRISARARGFIEAVAFTKGIKFIPALDAILQTVCKQYGFTSWDAVPEHKTARRASKAAKVAQAAQEVKQAAQDVPQDVQAAKEVKTAQDGTQAAGKPQEVTKVAKVASKTVKAAAGKAAGKVTSKKVVK